MLRSLHPIRRGWWLLLLIALLLPASVQAQSQSLFWERYDVDITVTKEGDLLVEERQSITFTSGSFHYGYRTIPMDKTDGIVNVEVWEGGTQFLPSSSGSEYTFRANEEGNELIVYWYFPYTSNSSHTYTFRYTVKGGVKINEEELAKLYEFDVAFFEIADQLSHSELARDGALSLRSGPGRHRLLRRFGRGNCGR